MKQELTEAEKEKLHQEYLLGEGRKLKDQIDFITTEYKPPSRRAKFDPELRSEVYAFLIAHKELPTTLAEVDKSLAAAESLFDKSLAAKPSQSPIVEPEVAAAVSRLAIQLRQLKLHLNKQAKRQADQRRKLAEQRRVEENARVYDQHKQEEAEGERRQMAEQAEADRKQKEAERIANLTQGEKFQFDALTAAANRCRGYLKEQRLSSILRSKYEFELSVAERGIQEILAGRMIGRKSLADEADLHRQLRKYRIQSQYTKDPERRQKLLNKIAEIEGKLFKHQGAR